MAKRSKIEMLPDNVLDELNHRLQNSRFSDYQQHSDWLHEQGYAIAKSTVHRHGQKLSKITSSKEEQALLDIFRQLKRWQIKSIEIGQRRSTARRH